jgi:hypothetical protein
MVRLNTFDAATLAQVASRKHATKERRFLMLADAGPEAKQIGAVIITGDRAHANKDQLETADRIVKWADCSRHPIALERAI